MTFSASNPNEWAPISSRNSRYNENRELIHIRFKKKPNSKYLVRFNIGMIVCELIDFKKGERVKVYRHIKHKDVLLIEKCQKHESGHQLAHTGVGNSLYFDFTFDESHGYKTESSICCNYEIQTEKKLIVMLNNAEV